MKSALLPLAFLSSIQSQNFFASASPSVFSISDDVLSFPQYRIRFPTSYINEDIANERLAPDSPAGEDEEASPERDEEIYTKAQAMAGSAAFGDASALPHLGADKDLYEFEDMLLHGHRYSCAIPRDDTLGKNASRESTSVAEQQKELVRAADRGWELLKDMEGSCIYYMSGWWSYSFCYGQQITQFHQLPPGQGVPMYPPAEDPTTPSYILGRFDAKQVVGKPKAEEKTESQETESSSTAVALAELQTQGETRYLVQKYGGGTTCDLTGKERKIEVQFHCNHLSTDRIEKIKEVTTCTYLMIIQTPRLCNDVAFLPPKDDVAHTIECLRVLKDDEVSAWEEEHTPTSKSTPLVGDVSQSRPIIGGVEFGAKHLVGTEGKVLKVGSVVENSKKKNEKVNVLSKSNRGKIRRLSKEDLRKLEIDPETVKTLEQELEELAMGKDWKLEIVDTPGQERELRGIIEGDDEIEESSKDDKATGASGKKPIQDDEEDERGSEEVYKEEL